MNIFSINFLKLISDFLLTSLRQTWLISFVRAMIDPLTVLYGNFMSNRADNIYTATITGQVCYLRKMLNDTFDAELRRITINDGNISDWILIYKMALFNNTYNKQPLMSGKADTITTTISGNIYSFSNGNTGVKMISKQGAIGSIGIDFAVNVPTDLYGIVDEIRMKSLLNYYKLASKRYVINYY